MPRPKKKGPRPTEPIRTHLGRCPSKHLLPHKISGLGCCSPFRCAQTDINLKRVRGQRLNNNGSRAKKAVQDETGILKRSETRLSARRAFFKTPQLQGTEAEDWADKKVVELLPDAVAEIEYQLKMGTDDQRISAAKLVLDATGRGKREAVNGGAQPIIILTGGATITPPWRAGALPAGVTGSVIEGALAQPPAADTASIPADQPAVAPMEVADAP